ncbi:cartilage intermediate layer protein 2-like isoform X2 [Acanthopagrus latus]|uniref:cartilage intermediate layer protein 2-like isoform X2 n=1 Tax=Acanthopagrus latus TaxID=8177 RepID=UPI00187C73A5|nr:cartilage intermediate layer protein 2-like isoform X2 [Acanthopagrus latus]
MIKLLGVAIIAGLLFAESDLLAIEAAEVQSGTPSNVLHHNRKRVHPFVCTYNYTPECWTGWFDRDDPSGTGDWETLKELRRENPGKICPEPGSMEVTTLSGLSVGTAGEVIFRNDLTDGFVCRNQDQSDRTCNDYRVRFSCPPQYCGEEVTVCWTRWYDRDDPSGTGDWEPLSNLRSENPGQICDNPLYIEAVTTGNNPVLATSTGQTFHVFNPTVGFVCRNADQRFGGCRDYQVRFGCPCLGYN